MQDIVLSTSPIMSSSRHQTASTPNSEHTKALKQEDEIHTGFYTSPSIAETTTTTAANTNYAAYNQRTNNFSVSNLANLDSTLVQNQQHHSWSAYPQYNKSNANGTFNQYQQYQAYQDLSGANNFYLRLPQQQTSPQPMGAAAAAAANKDEFRMENIIAPSYPIYNQLSSSQISSSSFNTSQSSSKSLSPKLNANEFPVSSSSSSSCNQQIFTVPQQQTSPLSSSLGNLSSSSNSTGYNGNNNQHGQQLNPIAVSTAPSSTNSSASLPASSAESFEWMKPVKSQPNGKTRTKDKYRVVYTEPQRVELEKEFLYSKYITIKRKSELSQVLNLSERQIKIWFQNRRAKDRKTSRKQRMESSNVTSTTAGRMAAEYSDSEDEGQHNNESDISIDDETSEDTKHLFRASKKSKKATTNGIKVEKLGNSSSEDLENMNKMRSVNVNPIQHSFNPYLQSVQSNFTTFTNGNTNNNNSMSPSAVATFGTYNQLSSSTPTYSQYFGSSDPQMVSNGHFVGSCQPNESLYQSYQYTNQAGVTPLGQSLDYNAFQQQQHSNQNDQYQYYQQQHLLLNGGSI